MDFFVVVLAIAVIAALVASASSRREVNEAWQEAASRLGLQANTSQLFKDPVISGMLDGCAVHIDIINLGDVGNPSERFTRYQIRYPRHSGLPVDSSLAMLIREGFRLTKQRARSGHDTFERLSPASRLQAKRLFTQYPGCVIDDSGVSWESSGIELSPNAIIGAVRRMVSFATHAAFEASIATPDAVAETPSHAVVPPSEAGADTLETVWPAEESTANGDSPVTPRHGVIAPDALPSVVGASEPDLPDGRPRGTNLEPAEVCGALFESAVLSTDTSRIFSERFRGQAVRWSGVLKGVAAYPFDRVFGKERGTKASIEVHQSATSYGARTVRAVVQLPPEALGDLRTRVGQRLCFEGELVDCDSFMRELYVRSGRVVDMDDV